jgi:hypothetical protein
MVPSKNIPDLGLIQGSDKENLCRVTVVYREERSKTYKFHRKCLKKLLEGCKAVEHLL